MFLSLLLSTLLTLVELNCENLFDTRHDSLKQDQEFLPEGSHRWTPSRYWRKLNRTGKTILACGEVGGLQHLPDLVALTEVENDSVLHDLTRRSLLRGAGYEYVMTSSPDPRGIDVALLYSPFSFRLLHHHAVRVSPPDGLRPTRDLLYAAGQIVTGDTLHVIVVHAPSRSGGERVTRPYRMLVAQRVVMMCDSIRQTSATARIVVAGDFNDYAADTPLRLLGQSGLTDVSARASGTHGARGTYRYQGEWGSLDHILCDERTARQLRLCQVFDAPFLMQPDETYGGYRPYRNYLGPRYQNGWSDHLPLVAVFSLDEEQSR